MAYGHWDGKDVHHADVRRMFTREALLDSEWYRARLRIKQERDIALWTRNVRALGEFLAMPGHREEARRLGITERLAHAREELERVKSPQYLASLHGTIGADPIHHDESRIDVGTGRSEARPNVVLTN
jgi:hypothetical protein